MKICIFNIFLYLLNEYKGKVMSNQLMGEDDWLVVVLKSKSENATKTLVNFYRFAEDLIGLKELHFLIRDCVDDSIIFSFRLLIKSKEKKDLENSITFQLGRSMAEDAFIVDPESEHPLYKFVEWPWRDTIKKRGFERFSLFCNFLSKWSKLVVEMAEKNYFESEERVEMTHVTSWMLSCTEYGIMSEKSWEIGYYDRISDKYHPYMTHIFKKEDK